MGILTQVFESKRVSKIHSIYGFMFSCSHLLNSS